MSQASFFSIARFVAWRNLRLLFKSPALLFPSLLFPLFFLVAFVGALSATTQLEGFEGQDYTAFQYVFALLQAAGYAGAMGGFALAEDFETGFMPRLMVAAPKHAAIMLGYTLGTTARAIISGAVVTAVAFLLGMDVGGTLLEVLGLFALVLLVTLITTLWSLGMALHVRSFNAAPGMALPVFLLLFLTPVFVPLDQLTGWLHAVASVNPLTPIVETGRGLLAGDAEDVALAFQIAGGLTLLVTLWSLHGVRSASRTAV